MSQLIQLFMDRARLGATQTPEELMGTLIARLRQTGRRMNNSNQRMQSFLRNRKIHSIETIRDLHCDGMLEPVGKNFPAGFTVRLNKQRNAARLRFTLAHELCHTFFYEIAPEIKFAPHEEDPIEERLCDFGAAELLMPAALIQRSARSMPVCLDSLNQLAGEHQVSLIAMFLRLRSLRVWNCELSAWHRMMNGEFVLDQIYGGKSLAWEWDDKSILRTAWKANKSAFGHSFVKFHDQRGAYFFKPTHYEVRRVGEKVLALWGASIERPAREYPLLEFSNSSNCSAIGQR